MGLHAKAYIRTALFGKKGFVDPEQLKQDLNLEFTVKTPKDLQLWIGSETLTLEDMKR